MAKAPGWLKMSAPYAEGGKVFVNVRVRPRHPSFIRMMWKLCRQEIRRRGANPNHPRLLLFTGYQLIKLFIKGGV